MALALCLTLLPTAALAEELGPVDGTSTVVTAGADADAEAKAKADAEAVATVQAMIGELPSLGELKGMDSDTLNEAYMAVQSAYDAYEALSEEQQAQVTGADRFEGLFGWFNSQVAVLEDSGDIYPDVVDADGGIKAGTTFTRNGPIVEDSNDSTTFYGNQYYVVKEGSNVTINGDLIIDNCTNNGLILCKGATLTVTGALIHKGGTFPIYGVSNSGKNAGRLVIRNTSGDGAAIRSSEENAQLQINSGELEISGGSSRELVQGVELCSTSKIHAATLSDNAASYKDWSEQSSLTGTSLVLEYCGHSSDYERYVDNGDGTHHMKCDLCGFEWTEGKYSQLNHQYDKYEKIDETYHKATCVCGYEASAQEHKFETGPDNKPVWTSDGKGHVSGVCACGYSSGTVDAHDYDESGMCKDCEFKPAFEDSKGNLYEYNGSDSIDALNEAIKKGETSFKLVKFAQGEGADAATVEAAFALETDANVTLDMNGKTLKASGGTPVLTVSSGALTVTGDAAIIQGGASQEMYKPAIEVTGGELIFTGALTATGASGKPAVEVTNGTLRLKAGDVLNGGVSVASGTVVDLLGENLAFAKKDDTSTIVKGDVKSISENVTVVAHTHDFKLNSDGKYVCACGYTCPHDEFENGVCKICGNGCAHTNVDENGVCENCKTQMAAKIEVGDKTTYTTDLGTTLHEAADGTKITLLANATVGNVLLKGKTVTLDLNGKTVKNSGRGGAKPIQIGPSNSSAKLIITGRGSFISVDQPLVVANGTLDLSQWTGDDSYIRHVTISGANSRFISPTGAGKINTLAFIDSDTKQAADTASLNGGRYGKIVYIRNNTIKLGDLLAEGYAFRQNGTFLEYAKELKNNDTVEEVEVVRCPHVDAEGGKCLYCNQDGILARVGDTTYGSVSDAVAAWMTVGGTLTLYADGGSYDEVDFSSAQAVSFVIDLNGHKFNSNGRAIKTGRKSLTITDSKEKTGSQGAFGPIDADCGTLTLESGCLEKLTVPSSSSARILLRGGKVTDILYPVPIFDLLEDGYALMSGDNPVDPAKSLFGSGVYTIKNSQTQFIDAQKNGEAAIGSNTIPFALLLKMADSEIRQMGFTWYIVEEDGTTQKLAATTSDVTSGADGVYTCNAANMTVDPNGWTGLEANKTYNVLCVVNGKTSDGTSKWQTPMRGYKLTVTPADLSQGAVVFTQTAEEFAGTMGNIGDGKGTFVFTPWGGNADSPSELSYLFKVTYNGQPLKLDEDYTIKGSSNLARNAGTHTLTIEGKGNYTGTATHQWEIKPYTLSKDRNVARIDRDYDGTTNLSAEDLIKLGCFSENLENRNSKNPSLGADQSSITIRLGAEDFEVSNVKLGSAEAGDTTASFTIKLKPRPGQTAANFVFEDGTSEMTVKEVPVSTRHAFLSSPPKAGELNVANDHAGVYTLDLSALLPKLESPKKYGEVTYALDTVSINGGYYDAAKGSAKVKDGKLILPIQAVKTSEENCIGTVKVNVTSGNIVNFPLAVNVNATNKIVPTGAPTLSKTTLAWGEQLSTITLSGTMTDPTDSTKTVKGKFEWVDGTVKPSAGSYEAAWKFTPTDGDTYIEADGTVTITVTKATPTGDPIYTRITAANKTLADANLKPNTSWPTGTIQWVDKDGKELENTTEVKANTAYKWIFTPTGADAGNYTTATGELILYSVSTGGGGGGGSSSGSTVKTDTTTKPDGTKVQTETRADGTKIQTETKKDGSTVKTTTNPNGSSVTESKDAAGSTGTVKTDKNGQTEAKTALSSKAIEDAKKSGEPVKAPVQVEATRNSNNAPVVKVELPKGAGETKVEIPVSNATPGTVAVLVHPDGTEEIVKNSVPTENGIQLTVDGSATVKIIDNSKGFIDTQDHWAKDAIDFVSARGLVNGMSATIYAPNNSTTRAQLWTILARQNDAELTGGATWYEKAQNWAKAKGISDGANPNADINRAQMVTMLWRAEGQPAAGGAASFTDVSADSYYAGAVSWAIENGITTGVGGGKFDPTATCTRAQIAAFLARSMK